MTEKVIQLRPSSYSEKLGNYIKQLEEENEKLKEEYITLEEDYGTSEIGNDKLRKRIVKAIEYIEDSVAVCAFGDSELPHWEFDDDNVVKLLRILKGEENGKN